MGEDGARAHGQVTTMAAAACATRNQVPDGASNDEGFHHRHHRHHHQSCDPGELLPRGLELPRAAIREWQPQLARLHLSGMLEHSRQAEALARWLRTNTSLTKLDVTHCRGMDECGIAALANAMQDNKTSSLSWVSLQGSPTPPDVMRSLLSPAVRATRSLVHIGLDNPADSLDAEARSQLGENQLLARALHEKCTAVSIIAVVPGAGHGTPWSKADAKTAGAVRALLAAGANPLWEELDVRSRWSRRGTPLHAAAAAGNLAAVKTLLEDVRVRQGGLSRICDMSRAKHRNNSNHNHHNNDHTVAADNATPFAAARTSSAVRTLLRSASLTRATRMQILAAMRGSNAFHDTQRCALSQLPLTVLLREVLPRAAPHAGDVETIMARTRFMSGEELDRFIANRNSWTDKPNNE